MSKGISVSAFIVALLLAAFFAIPRLLKITRIDCTSQYGVCGGPSSEKLKELEGRTLFEVKKKAANILAEDIGVLKFSFQLNLPGTLKIRMVLRKSQFAVKGENGDFVGKADARGVIVEFDKDSALPTLELSRKISSIGETLENGELFAAEILSGMFSLYGVKEGRIRDRSLTIAVPSGPEVIFPLEGDESVLLGAARLIISRLNKERENLRIGMVRQIDLRFKNPVLRLYE